jgi:hypothetical protein
MGYAMFARSLRAVFQGIHCTIQANDMGDLQWSEVLARVSRFEQGS